MLISKQTKKKFESILTFKCCYSYIISEIRIISNNQPLTNYLNGNKRSGFVLFIQK